MLNTDFVTPDVLTGYVREVPAPASWILNQFLPDVERRDVEAVIEQVTRHNRAARFRAYDAETPIGQRDQTTRDRITLPPLGEKLLLTEWERLQLERVRTGGDNATAVADQIYDDAATASRHVRARMELARGDVLTDGRFTLTNENGLTLEADFGLPGSHSVTAATLWSDNANATVVSDLRDWADTYTDDAGEPPGAMLASREIVSNMLQNQEVRDLVGSMAGTPSIVTRQQLATALEAHGLPPVMEYNARIEGPNGATTRPIPNDRLVLMPEDPSSLGSTVWGITAEALDLAGSDNPTIDFEDTPGLIGVVEQEGDPIKTLTKVTGVGLPIIADPNKLFVATVL